MRKHFLILLSLLTTLFSNNVDENISVQLSWLHQFQSAGFYIALEKGFYKDAGLNVEIKEFTQNTHTVDDVIEQKSHYGVGRSSLIIDRANQKPVVALMAFFQSSPSVLIITDPSIKKIEDLKHKMIMVTQDEVSSIPITGMLLSQGIRKDDFFKQPHSFNLNDLINGNADAMACYISNEPFLLNERHIPYTLFSPPEYGFDFYSDILFTSESEIQQHPKRVKEFYEATKKGWEWAFSNIKETAYIIFSKYNTQNKSFNALLYEGTILKELAYKNNKPFGIIEAQKIEEIAMLYKLSGLLKNNFSPKGFIDPLFLSKQEVKIGVLTHRDDEKTLKQWKATAEYLSEQIPTHHFSILPLHFLSLENNIKEKNIDFIVTNPMVYITLEYLYGATRIATLSNLYKNHYYDQYGSVIFSSKKKNSFKSVHELPLATIGAVNPNSLGGFVMAQKALGNPSYLERTLFFHSHDDVVRAVLDGSIDVGIVRTSILELMQQEGIIKIDDINIINAKHYPKFPFLVSTELYPEWPFVKLSHTKEELSNTVLSALIKTSYSPKYTQNQNFKWKTPLDYTKVHLLLKEFNLFPYDNQSFTPLDVLQKYRIQGFLFIIFFLVLTLSLWRIKTLNQKLRQHTAKIENFNTTLENEVKERTNELTLLNHKLQELSNTDELTKISNRRHFLELAEFSFNAAKRHHFSLYLLSIDIDFFKKVNDTYGHLLGDEVLKHLCKTISTNLRSDDVFGRIGGEEFSICVQNTSRDGVIIFAEKIRQSVEASPYEREEDKPIFITISIGISMILETDKTIFESMKRADDALYTAKNSGRNRVCIH